MHFFEQQDSSRKKTAWLLAFFAFGLVGIVLSLNLALALVLWYFYDKPLQKLWQPELFLAVTLGASVVIILGTLIKIFRLRQGGSYIAERLGGKAISRLTQDPKEKVLINVVEEISLSSGVPMPAVYVLEREKGINAFAAGYSPDDAAVAVTRGCLEQLNRDELQGVIGHEFSHILNGDMHLNIKLMGVLGGIVLLSTIGQHLLEWSSRISYRSSDNKKNLLPLIGLALIVVGYVGLLFGRIIKSAISRQREFLADASAVQFTRNPQGIASALKKIGGFSEGSAIRSPLAEEASHMFFSDALKVDFFASHPPLAERIHRIEPSFRSPKTKTTSSTTAASSAAMGFSSGNQNIQTSEVTAAAAAPSPAFIVPESLQADLKTPYGTTLTVLSLLLPADPSQRQEQIERVVQRHLIKRTTARSDLLHSYKNTQQLAPEHRLSLLDLAEPAFAAMSARQKAGLLEAVQTLITYRKKISLFAFFLQKILESKLNPPQIVAKPIQNIKEFLPDAWLLLSLLSHAGKRNPQAAFQKARAILDTNSTAALVPQANISFAALDAAFNLLKSLAPPLQEQFMTACLACIAQENTLNKGEIDFLRVLSHTLNRPLPRNFMA
jgi:Zn-dependent protease with chaperone function